jgi:hypothetical protein
MAMKNTYLDDRGRYHPDRRGNITAHPYDDVSERIDRFYHSNHDWAGTSTDFMALRVVHEAYPELSPQEIRTLVTAIGHASCESWAKDSPLTA